MAYNWYILKREVVDHKGQVRTEEQAFESYYDAMSAFAAAQSRDSPYAILSHNYSDGSSVKLAEYGKVSA